MANQTVTPNLQLALPGDDSHNTPWGISDQVLAQALNTIDAQLVTAIQTSKFIFGVDTGSANAYAVAISPAVALTAGLTMLVKFTHANTGASTLALNGGSAKSITKNGTTALAGAEISANQIGLIVYDGTQWQLISQ